MLITRKFSPEAAIRINVLVDAYVTSFLGASVGYLTIQSGLESQGAMHAVGIGIVIGTVLSLLLRDSEMLWAKQLSSVVCRSCKLSHILRLE